MAVWNNVWTAVWARSRLVVAGGLLLCAGTGRIPAFGQGAVVNPQTGQSTIITQQPDGGEMQLGSGGKLFVPSKGNVAEPAAPQSGRATVFPPMPPSGPPGASSATQPPAAGRRPHRTDRNRPGRPASPERRAQHL